MKKSQPPTHSQPERNRWGDLTAGLFLQAALAAAGVRLTATHWTEDLGLIQTVAFLGCLAGLALGQSRFSRKMAGLFALAYGTFVVPWQLGMTILGDVAWPERLWSMAGRLELILSDIFIRRAVEDNLFFLLLMTCLFWSLGVTTGFSLARFGEPWRVILPPGITLFVVDLFDPKLPRRSWYMAVYIFLSLLILGRMAFLRQRLAWQKLRVYIPPDIGFDIGRYAALTSLVVVIFAWNMISLNRAVPIVSDAYQVMRAPYLDFKDKNSFLFAALESSFTDVIDFYGSYQPLGSGSVRSDQVVMNVDVPGRLPSDLRLYWRARSYDLYQRGQWSSVMDESKDFLPEDGLLPMSGLSARTDAQLVFRPLTGIVTLYGPSQSLWFSRPGKMLMEEHSDDTLDFIGLKAEPYIRPGEQYRVQARLGIFTQKQLREASDVYPYWVMARYVQLPEDITPRTRQLALEITAQATNPYDKAQAIVNWLRDNIEYEELIQTPPVRQEPLDWFLFDYRKGFCNYYASAAVIMMRSVGIPARWTVGYAQGERQIQISNSPDAADRLAAGMITYKVREKDAHAWPEVYFPYYGWVEFEPTVSETPIIRPTGEEPVAVGLTEEERLLSRTLPEPEPELTPMPTARPDQAATAPETPRSNAYLAIFSASAALLILILVVFSRQSDWFMRWLRIAGGSDELAAQWEGEGATSAEQLGRSFALLGRRLIKTLAGLGFHPPEGLQNWANYTLQPLIAQAYQQVNLTLQRLGESPAVSATPAERAARVTKLLPEAEKPVNSLLAEYQKASYSSTPPDLDAARQSSNQLRLLTRAFLLKKWFGPKGQAK